MKKITIYTTPTCSYCKMTKAFFKEHDVQYEEHDVSQDMEAQEKMLKLSGQMGVPVIDVDGTIIIGFNQTKLTELIGIKQQDAH